MLKQLKSRFLDWWYFRHMKRHPEKVVSMLQEVLNPLKVDWDLTHSDKIILDRYVAKFVEAREIAYEDMDVSEEYNPNLHRLVEALQGLSEQRLSWAAYDWMLEQYPDLEKLTEELGGGDNWD